MIRAASLALACFLPAVCALAQGDIVVGQVVDLSGRHSYIGRDFSAGAGTYFEEVNAGGGINGRRIKYLLRDDKGDPAATVKLTDELLSSDKPQVLLGYFGDAGIRSVLRSATFLASGATLFAPITGIDHSAESGNLFILRASLADEIEKIVGHLAPLGTSHIAAVYTSDDYGKGALAILEHVSQAARIHVTSQSAGFTNAEVMAGAARIAYSDAQAVLVFGDTLDAARFIKVYRKSDRGTPIYALSIVNHKLLRELVGAEGSLGIIIAQVVPHPADAQFKVSRELLALMSKYRDEPPSHMTMEGFISAKVLVRALRERAPLTGGFAVTKVFDAGDFLVSFQPRPARAGYVDLTMLTRQGELLH